MAILGDKVIKIVARLSMLLTFFFAFVHNYSARAYHELHHNYTSALGKAADLDNTGRLTAVSGIGTAFFVATTVYLVICKPKENCRRRIGFSIPLELTS
jgi:hypothetical protein